jgi:cysteinyl-tRNA synthetase
VVLLREIKAAGFDPLAYRYLLLTAHYRSKINFSYESLTAAQNGLNNLRADLASLPVEGEGATGDWSEEAQRVRDAFHTAINDDIDLPAALSITREAARNHKIAPAERRRLLLDFDRVLGLRLETVEAAQPRVITDEALALVRERDAARAARDWKRSDQLRDQLIALGYEVRDTPRGTELV